MYIYLASNTAFRKLSIGKIGYTENLYGRRSTYLTGCPPNQTPSQDIDYDLVVETTATTRDELYDFEDEVHDKFNANRLIRETPGDSEWFDFQGKNPYDEVMRFMETSGWVKRYVPLSEIRTIKKSSRYLRKHIRKNLLYIKVREFRNATLNHLQKPVISAIEGFMSDVSNRAGFVIAPCGSGKTIMTCRGIRGIRKIVICCPSKQIATQWESTLLEEGIFTESQIHIVGGAGTTEPSIIRAIFDGDVFCVISTYMSSHLLVDVIKRELDLLVLDEAHHMAGIVARDEKGEGRTRRLMMKAIDLGVKRLSLTYTPRFIANGGGNDAEYLTMDDCSNFGEKIVELKIRDLIRMGVLPDYRLWTLRDQAKKGTGIIGKAECILEAWEAKEIIREEEKYILHHLIVFASTTQEAKDLQRFFKANTTNTLVLRVEEGDNLECPIAQFTSASRAILVNCFVLNEGVDIPIANAVAITYPKQSRGQITQMVLRAGRWYEGKSIFHILIPMLGDDEEWSGTEEVLSALASCDEQIRDEIMLRTKPGVSLYGPLPSSPDTGGTLPECIMMEHIEANQEEIKRCFMNIRNNFYPAKDSRCIQEKCIEEGIDTSIDYAIYRSKNPDLLPEDPRPKAILWYDYLHPKRSHDRITSADFVKTILDLNNLRAGHTYDEWLCKQSPDDRAILPSVQQITDGFFGKENTNFNTLIETFGKKTVGRGR